MYQMSQHYSISVQGPSPLEYLARSAKAYHPAEQKSYAITASSRQQYTVSPNAPMMVYNSLSPYSSQGGIYQLAVSQREYHFQPDDFLIPGQEGIFVGEAEHIKPFIEEAFIKMFGEKFPADIKISVLHQEQFRALAPHPGTIGLSMNRRKLGLLSEIFVLSDSLARVLLTVGHELGHVLTETLQNKHDEEAKAYAFSLAWIKVIREQNIAGLQHAIVTEMPAENGLHNVAFFFVEKLLRMGENAWNVYQQIIKRLISLPVDNYLLYASS